MKIGQYLFVFLITFLLFGCSGKNKYEKAVDRAYDRSEDLYDKAMDDAEDLMREYGY